MQPHLSTRPAEIQQLVHGLDPNDVRLAGNAVRAKQVLEAWVNEEEMTPAIKTEWAAALDQVSGAPPAGVAARPRIPAPAFPPAAAPAPLLPPAAQGPPPAAPVTPPAAPVTPPAAATSGSPVFRPLPPEVQSRKTALIRAVRQLNDPSAKAKLDSLGTALGLETAKLSTIKDETDAIIKRINNLVSNPSVAKQQMDDVAAKVSTILDHQF
jgi:hypothetical protein